MQEMKISQILPNLEDGLKQCESSLFSSLTSIYKIYIFVFVNQSCFFYVPSCKIGAVIYHSLKTGLGPVLFSFNLNIWEHLMNAKGAFLVPNKLCWELLQVYLVRGTSRSSTTKQTAQWQPCSHMQVATLPNNSKWGMLWKWQGGDIYTVLYE